VLILSFGGKADIGCPAHPTPSKVLYADTPLHATQRFIKNMAMCPAWLALLLFVRSTPFLNVFVCPLAEGLNHRVI
jgi:hypothetical protein